MHKIVEAENMYIADMIVPPANVADVKVIKKLVNETHKLVYAFMAKKGGRAAPRHSQK